MADMDTKSGAAAPPAAPAAPVTDGMTRRQALRAGMFATVGAFFATVGGGAAGMFWPIKLTGFGSIVPSTKKLSEIKMGEVVTVREGKYYLTRTEEGLLALYWKCVHLGCTVPFNTGADLFMCPCHGSVYDKHGDKVAGPAPRALDYMAIEVKGNDILVNTGKITQRDRYEPGQATPVKGA